MSRAEYMRTYRATNDAQRDRAVRAARAKKRALMDLANVHHRAYIVLLNERRWQEGLPPLRGSA